MPISSGPAYQRLDYCAPSRGQRLLHRNSTYRCQRSSARVVASSGPTTPRPTVRPVRYAWSTDRSGCQAGRSSQVVFDRRRPLCRWVTSASPPGRHSSTLATSPPRIQPASPRRGRPRRVLFGQSLPSARQREARAGLNQLVSTGRGDIRRRQGTSSRIRHTAASECA